MIISRAYKYLLIHLCVLLLLSISAPAVYAEFLEMPEIEQLKEIRKKTLLKDMDIPSVRVQNTGPRRVSRAGHHT